VSISGFVDTIVVSTLSDVYPITASAVQTAFGGGIHLKGLLQKLQVSNRIQAAVWALNNGYAEAQT
jgi:hypothetical protein